MTSPSSKDFSELGMVHKETKGARIVKGTRKLHRDTFLKGSLCKKGYYRPEEKATLEAEIAHVEFQTHGKPLPSLKQRALMMAPPHPNSEKSFNHSKSNLTKAERFRKKDSSSSPGPVYLPQVHMTSQVKKSSGYAYGPDRDGGMAIIQRGPLGKQIVKPRSRDRAWFLQAKMNSTGYMYKIEDPAEIADVGHASNKDITNESLYKKVKPAVAGMGLAERFSKSMRPQGAPGPKYSPSYSIDSRKSATISHRFGTRNDGKLDRSKAMATGILKNGVMLNQTAGNINDVGPGSYSPSRLFDGGRKHVDYGFGEAQMEWMVKKEKHKVEQLKKMRKRARKARKKAASLAASPKASGETK
eukprot:CAMPEP_0167825536 /NCGR_PEP_ID=MMETSP0112_2-20121227/9433_1 /TAXON_ID=91324 /ORGANISM="Lotharella globosa, Strain CCCM811" /LENGTH=356 /DNA_ID=CAMNT_0007727679 /DNA_START=175 /DNA_END=1244 /DNA_ORIENTATION=+